MNTDKNSPFARHRERPDRKRGNPGLITFHFVGERDRNASNNWAYLLTHHFSGILK
ncbi:hypothetical protein JYT29_01330 [Nitrospina gracilis]|nr:hypothetical protein [Nitrospina gracilis]